MRHPRDPWRAWSTGLAAAGIGAAVLAGTPAAAASPSESSASESSGSESSGASERSERTPRADRGVSDGTRSIDRRRSARAAARGADREEPSRSPTRELKADPVEMVDATAAESEPEPPAKRAAPEKSRIAELTTDAATPEPAAPEKTSAAAAIAPTRAVTLRTVASARPVTVADILTDTLTWVGLGRFTDGLPVPAAPVPSIVESLWLAVRQTQYTWNNQRPRADVTVSGPGPDGEITGNLNAVDYDDADLTYTLRTGPEHGTVVLDGAGGFTYTPDGSGRADSFTVAIDDTVGNPFHVHGLAGLLGRSGPTRVEVIVAGSAAPTDLSDVTVVKDSGGRVAALDGRFTDRTVASAADAADVLNEMAATLGIAGGFARPSAITATRLGVGSSAETVYRLTESVAGVEVVGSDIILVTDIDGAVTGLFNNYRALNDTFDVTPDVTLDDLDEIRQAVYTLSPDNSLRNADLIVYALDDETPRLAWRVVVERPDNGELAPSAATVVFHADGPYVGDVIVTTGSASAYSATGYARDWLGNYRAITTQTREVSWYKVRELFDDARNITTYRTSYPFFGLLGPVLPGTVVKRGWFGWDRGSVSAHANAAVVYDYFATVLGRTSYDDAGAPIEISVRYAPALSRSYANAFWDPIAAQFVFGNQGYLQAALDVVAHEFAHAVVTSVVGGGEPVLDFAESGALNEAYADILGVLIEGKQGRDRWLMGEDSELGAIRNLANPGSIRTSLGPHRAHYDDRYTGSADDYGEHINSTIFSHAAYRMMTDPATAGIADDTWAAQFYQSLARLGAGARFVDGRVAVINTARALDFTAAQVTAIEKAFNDVGIVAGTTTSIIAA
ncbi:M4 family metallopeptidase [Mycolicibacterium duvalii]|uniref:M4 family metallopeptidase n=1 Tax=Mycolicibacterium duvalii TaxID=39688 RepID=UPI001F43C5AB|nr:M4 family metallopeptidase [Mycolicibacterium duvalii]